MSLTSLFPDMGVQKIATVIIGLVSLFSAVLITMNQYVKSQQMMEAHRSAGLSYGKLHRMIMNELTLRRDQRTNGLYFLRTVRLEIDRLENTAPSIIPSIIKKFNVQFANNKIEKPEITGDLDEVDINKEELRKKEMLLSKRSMGKLRPFVDNFIDVSATKINIINEKEDDYIIYSNKKSPVTPKP